MVQVLNIERAEGCRPELIELLEAWKIHGSFDILVAVDGGYRFGALAEATQARFFRLGMSKAATLKQTPHGRRCAVDCHPVGFRTNRDFASQPGMREKFQAWGAFVEAAGLVWGGRFGGFGKDGDMPHAEIRNWRELYAFPSGDPVSP